MDGILAPVLSVIACDKENTKVPVYCTPEDVMKHENENGANLHTGLKRREFMAMLAGCTASIMMPSLLHGEEDIATSSPSDRLGKLLPLRKLGSSGPVVTNLGVGGDHVGSAPEKDAQAIIEKALEEGVRFFDNAPLYSDGKAEERYGKFLTPKYRDVSFIMTKSLARNREAALKDIDASLSRMKTDYVDLWQVHALENPKRVEERIQNGILDAYLEAQKKGKVKYIGFTGHQSYKAHLKMLEEINKRGVKMTASQMPVNPADPHFESFVINVVPKCVEAGIGVLAMKTLAYGRFFGGNKGWRRTEVSVKPAIPAVLSVEDVFGFVWSLPVTTLISGMESVQQVSQNAAIARKTWNWNQAERQKRIDAMASFSGPDLEFYKS